LEKALANKTRNIALSDIELTVFGQGNGPVKLRERLELLLLHK
jgi:hypothetical protein